MLSIEGKKEKGCKHWRQGLIEWEVGEWECYREVGMGG